MAVNKPERIIVKIQKRYVGKKPASVFDMGLPGRARLSESPDVLLQQLSPINKIKDLLLDLELSDSEDEDVADWTVKQQSPISSNQQLPLDWNLAVTPGTLRLKFSIAQ